MILKQMKPYIPWIVWKQHIKCWNWNCFFYVCSLWIWFRQHVSKKKGRAPCLPLTCISFSFNNSPKVFGYREDNCLQSRKSMTVVFRRVSEPTQLFPFIILFVFNAELPEGQKDLVIQSCFLILSLAHRENLGLFKWHHTLQMIKSQGAACGTGKWSNYGSFNGSLSSIDPHINISNLRG